MSTYKAALIDVDGVLVQAPRLFSEVYAEKHGLKLESLTPFFSSQDFKDALLGKLDFKTALQRHQDKWQYSGSIDELIQEWLEVESHINTPLVDIVQKLRAQGIKTYLATQQEQNRARYLSEHMFKDQFDGMFVSCQIGYGKKDPQFWQSVLQQLATDIPGIKPSEVIYFDDSQDYLEAAKQSGIETHLYQNPSQVSDLILARIR